MKILSISFIATALIQVATMIGGVLSARLLLPQGKGELTAVILWPSLIATLGSLGLYDAVVFYSANEPEFKTKRVFASGMALALALSCGLMVIGYLILPAVLSGYNDGMLRTSLLYLWYIPLALITSCLMGTMLGKLEVLKFNFLRTFVHVATTLGIVMLYLVGNVSVRNFALASLVSSLATLLLAVGFFIPSDWFGESPEWVLAKRLISYGTKVHMGSVAGLLNQRLDQMLLSIFLPSSILGLYVVAVSIGSVTTLAASTIALVAFPYIANVGSETLKREAFGRFMRLSLFMSLASAGGVYVLTPFIIRYFFGETYLEAAGPARVLTFGSILLGGNILFAAGLKALNHPFASSKAETVGLSVTAVSLMILLPTYQALGAAWASLFAYCASFLYMVWHIRQQVGIPPSKLLVPTLEDWRYLEGILLRRRRQLDPSTSRAE